MSTRFEYCRKGLKWEHDWSTVLNEMDEKGWEFVSAVGTGLFRDRSREWLWFIFRRPRQS